MGDGGSPRSGLKDSDRWVILQEPDPYGSDGYVEPRLVVGRLRPGHVLGEKGDLFPSTKVIPSSLPAPFTQPEEIFSPIRQAITCHQHGVDGIHIPEQGWRCLLLLGPELESVLQLMDPRVLALVSRKPCPKGVVHLRTCHERRGGLFRTSHACVASSGQAPS